MNPVVLQVRERHIRDDAAGEQVEAIVDRSLVESYRSHQPGRPQSKRSGLEEPLAFRGLGTLFLRAEADIALLARCRPTNEASERERWLQALRAGRATRPEWVYAPKPNLGRLRARLEELQAGLYRLGALGALYAARAAELGLEAELAEQIGTPRFFELARQRYPIGATAEWALAREQSALWAARGLEPDPAPLIRSDDERSPQSLVSQLRRELGRYRLPVRVEMVTRLGSHAATAEGVIFVRAGMLLGAQRSLRIARHEVLGHALPRVHAQAQPVALFRAGSAQSSDDEEGRALGIEQREGLLDEARRQELGLRHVAALAVAEGATALDCIERLTALGQNLEAAVDVYGRVARGGGLCRELVYLPAWRRVEHTLACDPDLERWLECGRLSLVAATALRALGIAPDVSLAPADVASADA